MCEILCVLTEESLSYSSCSVLYTSPAGLQSPVFWGLIFLVQDPQAGEPVGLVPWGESAVVIFLLFVGCPPGVLWYNISSLSTHLVVVPAFVMGTLFC